MWRYVLLSLCAALCVLSCVESGPVGPTPVPSINLVSAPSFLLCNVDSLYIFSVRLDDFDDPDSLYCFITRPDGTIEDPFRLYDDGNVLHSTIPYYTGLTSGDVVANNGTYTRSIWSTLLCNGEQGKYIFQFEAINGSQRLTGEAFNVEVRAPVECGITSEVLPTTFAECFDETTVSVTISEDAEVPIDTVRMSWISGDTLWWEQNLTRGNGGIWHYDLTPAAFQCTPTGSNYTVRFDAYNAFGLSCSHDVSGISFENGLPILSNPQLPDTLYRPLTPGDTNTITFNIGFSDCELANWAVTQAVLFDVRREDADWTLPRPGDNFLRNDGIPPDAVAGDTIASSFLLIINNGRVNDLYYLRYFSIDCASNDSTDYLLDSVRIIQPGAIIGGGDNRNSSDLGLSCYK